MRKFLLSVGLVVAVLLVGSQSQAWHAGYQYGSNVTSMWGQATPGLCATCTQGQDWSWSYGTRWVEVWTDMYSRIYVANSAASGQVFVATTRDGSAVSVSLAKKSYNSTVVVATINYRDVNNVARSYRREISIPGWTYNGGRPLIYSYGTGSSIPSAIVDSWVSTIPYNASKVVSGAQVCGQPGFFSVRKIC